MQVHYWYSSNLYNRLQNNISSTNSRLAMYRTYLCILRKDSANETMYKRGCALNCLFTSAVENFLFISLWISYHTLNLTLNDILNIGINFRRYYNVIVIIDSNYNIANCLHWKIQKFLLSSDCWILIYFCSKSKAY